MTTKEIQELRKWDQEHIAHPAYRVGGELTWVVDKAKGRATVIDIEGNEYLDGASQLICVNLGYGRTEIIEAMKEQMDRIPYYPQQYGVSNLTTIKCAQKLAELTPEGLDHFFFTSGGGDSNETLFRLARRYWNVKGTNKYKIISLYEGYHGTSLGAITATGVMKGALRKRPSPPPAGFLHIPAPYCYRCPFGKEYPDCGIQCAQYLAYVIESEDPETVAAFIAEPVLGVAGMVVPPPEYWPMVRKICNEHDVLLIADEIITGFCRTGKMFAVENWGVKPDMMALAKGITNAYFPFGAAVFSAQIYEGLKGEAFWGYTYGGHPTGAAAAIKTMELYEKENVAENAARVGKYALERINTEFTSLPCVAEASGLGLTIGIEIVADKATKKAFDPTADVAQRIQDEALKRGLIVRVSSSGSASLGDRCVFSPPLVISEEEADRMLDILYSVLSDLKTT